MVKEKYGVPESVTLGQAIYESGLGKSNIANQANNWFGMKGSGTAGQYNSTWAKYNSVYDSFDAYGKLLSKDRYTKHTKNATTDSEYINGIIKGGYCDDEGYTTNILSIISSNKLDRYNTGEFIGNSDDDTVTTTSDNSSLVGKFLSGVMRYIMIAVLVVVMLLLMVFAFTPQRG